MRVDFTRNLLRAMCRVPVSMCTHKTSRRFVRPARSRTAGPRTVQRRRRLSRAHPPRALGRAGYHNGQKF